MYDSSGSYTYTSTNSEGCDSIVTLNLIVNKTSYSEQFITACENYLWHNVIYDASGDYYFTSQNINGCDSIETIHLTINHTSENIDSITTCSTELPFNWQGNSYYTNGIYSKNYTNKIYSNQL
jgi:hypothetical protein